jgi:hypothetical protein
MLGNSYSDQIQRLVSTLDYGIQLPEAWSNFFVERGECNSYLGDNRKHRRIKARTYGALWFDKPWILLDRPAVIHGVYSKDFSLRGCGFVTSFEIFPDEIVRILLPTFWLTIRVVRCQRIQDRCFDVGGILIRQFEPSENAFEGMPSYQLASKLADVS